jgi:hypothetical protein
MIQDRIKRRNMMKTIVGGFFMAMLLASGAQAEIHSERIEYRQGDTLLEGFLAVAADELLTHPPPKV